MKSTNPEPLPTIYYDAECPLCNKLVHKLQKREKKDIFQFTPLQLSEFKGSQTIIFKDHTQTLNKSDAALRIAQRAGIWKPLIFLAFLFPKKFRDKIYDFIARHRHKIKV